MLAPLCLGSKSAQLKSEPEKEIASSRFLVVENAKNACALRKEQECPWKKARKCLSVSDFLRPPLTPTAGEWPFLWRSLHFTSHITAAVCSAPTHVTVYVSHHSRANISSRHFPPSIGRRLPHNSHLVLRESNPSLNQISRPQLEH
jgi:hypothetical protein